MIQVWINKDEAANVAELAVKLNALVKERSNGQVLGNDRLLNLLRGFVIFVDEARKDEAAKLAEAKQIEHTAIAFIPAAKREEVVEGHGIAAQSRNVVYVISESTVTAAFQDLKAADFEKVIKALEATLKARAEEEKAAAEAAKE